MAIITNALIAALNAGFKKTFQDAYTSMEATTFYKDVAIVVNSTSASETYGWLGDFPEMREWVGDRVIRDMKEHGYQITNREFEATVGVNRSKIEDDNLGMYTPLMQEMANSAARQPDQMVSGLLKAGASTLCYDGQNFFDTDHPVYANHDGTGAVTTVSNYDDNGGDTSTPAWYLLDTSRPLRPLIFQNRKKPQFVAKTDPNTSDSVFMNNTYLYGVDARRNVGFGFWHCAYKSHAALSEANFDAALEDMMSVKGDGDRPLGIMPTLLLVPPRLRSAANKIVLRELGDGGASNPNHNAVDVKVVPWLA